MGSDTVKVLVAQLCLTLCDTMDCSPPGFSVPGIFQARILESLLSLGLSSPGDLLDPGMGSTCKLQDTCFLADSLTWRSAGWQI